jgi:diaminopimelate epimerase
MCGNGIRCVAKFVYDRGIAKKSNLKIETGRGVLALELSPGRTGLIDQVRVNMGAPILESAQIPTTLAGNPPKNVPLDVAGKTINVTCVSMGNPHCVVFVDNATDDWVLDIGPKTETDPHFPKRVNVEFVEVLSRGELRQRTWERGSSETFACGTGACAVTVAGALSGRTDRKVKVHLRGGDLVINWNEHDNHVSMTGPAVEVFSGEWRE